MPSGSSFPVSSPLAVPFPAKCANSECLNFGVQSRKSRGSGRRSYELLRIRSTLQIVAVRKQGRNQKARASNRRRPFNPKIIGSNICEARDELNKLLARIDAGALHEEELQVGLLHAYHHLNFAWNIRRVATSRYTSLTQQEFEAWGKYPSDIETFGE